LTPKRKLPGRKDGPGLRQERDEDHERERLGDRLVALYSLRADLASKLLSWIVSEQSNDARAITRDLQNGGTIQRMMRLGRESYTVALDELEGQIDRTVSALGAFPGADSPIPFRPTSPSATDPRDPHYTPPSSQDPDDRPAECRSCKSRPYNPMDPDDVDPCDGCTVAERETAKIGARRREQADRCAECENQVVCAESSGKLASIERDGSCRNFMPGAAVELTKLPVQGGEPHE